MNCKHKIASQSPGGCFICLRVEELHAEETDRAEALAAKMQELFALKTAHVAERCRRSLAEFVKTSWHVLEDIPLDWNWHVQALCDHIQAMLTDQWEAMNDKQFQQRCQNLAINVPPGSLKSRILSVCAPAWAWMHRPRWTLLAMSANPGVADRDAESFLKLVQSDWYRATFKITWRITRDAIKNIENSAGGTRKSRGMESKIVGIRADAIFLDDPNDVKDCSDIKLAAVAQRWKAAQNRVNDDRVAIRILIQQRTHEKDLTGVIFDKGNPEAEGVDWEHLAIPMLKEKAGAKCTACNVVHEETFLGWKDPRTHEGQSMHEERFTDLVIARMKRALGSYGFAGQGQQRPSPEGGGLFKTSYWRTFDPDNLARNRVGELKCDTLTISVDANFKEEGTSNCAVGVLMSIGPKVFVLEMVKGKWDILAALVQIERLIKKYGEYTKILIEDKANGSAMITMLGAKYRAVVGCQPEGGKMPRAVAMLPDIEAGDYYLPRHAPWRESFEQEFAAFPVGSYDDQIDVVSQVANDLRDDDSQAQARAMGLW